MPARLHQVRALRALGSRRPHPDQPCPLQGSGPTPNTNPALSRHPHPSCLLPASPPGSCLTAPAAPSPPPHPATRLCPPPERHPHSINGPAGWGHRAQGPTSLPRVLVAVAFPAPRHGLLRRSWGPRWPADCPQWPPCPVGLHPLAQAGRACWGLLAPWMPPPALLKILCRVFSGQSLPQVQRGLPSCTSPRGGDSPESAEASEPLAAVSHHTRGAGSADPGSAPSCCWCQVLPSVASARACGLPILPSLAPPIPLRHLFVPWRHCPPRREPESSGGN